MSTNTCRFTKSARPRRRASSSPAPAAASHATGTSARRPRPNRRSEPPLKSSKSDESPGFPPRFHSVAVAPWLRRLLAVGYPTYSESESISVSAPAESPTRAVTKTRPAGNGRSTEGEGEYANIVPVVVPLTAQPNCVSKEVELVFTKRTYLGS